MRRFEKISFKQFALDIKDDKELYNEYKLIVRKTKGSAGYDFFSIEDFSIEPGEIKRIPTGIKSIFPNDEVLLLFVRGNVGYKWNVRMCNQVGLIDSDFYNNVDNEGHIWFALQNEGDNTFIVHRGESFGQGIFIKYFKIDNEEEINNIRKGGFGSTNNMEE